MAFKKKLPKFSTPVKPPVKQKVPKPPKPLKEEEEEEAPTVKKSAARFQWKLDDIRNEIAKMRETKVKLPGDWEPEEANEFRKLLAELIERDSESISLYEALPTAIKFHACMAHEVGLSGSNRAGKTCTASMEVAMAATGQHPIKGKYPEKECYIACIGNDGRHLSLMYEYLFEKAPYRVFFHPETYDWHVVVEHNPEHKKYEHLWKDAQPVIPPRMVKYVSWENKKEKIPKSVGLVNGTVIRFYSGLVRKMPQGRKFHLVWMDEEIEQAGRWLKEMRARIIDLNGRIFWSATPQLATEEFADFEMRADDPDNAALPLSQQTAYFVMKSRDNKFISEEGVAAFAKKLEGDEEEIQTRIEGQSARNYLTVYPEFNQQRPPSVKNLLPSFTLKYEDTIHVIIDPGVDVCGVLFIACPAPVNADDIPKLTDPYERIYRGEPGCIVIFDELYIRRANAQLVAQQIKDKMSNYPQNPRIQRFTIDLKGSKLSFKGMKDERVETVYMREILAHDIIPMQPGWSYGSTNVTYGIETTKEGLVASHTTGHPHIFYTQNCKKFAWEMKAWKKKRDSKGNFIGYEEANHHLLDCLRYARTNPEVTYVPPPEPKGPKPLSKSDFDKSLRGLRSGQSFFS